MRRSPVTGVHKAIAPQRYDSQSAQSIQDAIVNLSRDVKPDTKGEQYNDVYAMRKQLTAEQITGPMRLTGRYKHNKSDYGLPLSDLACIELIDGSHLGHLTTKIDWLLYR